MLLHASAVILREKVYETSICFIDRRISSQVRVNLRE